MEATTISVLLIVLVSLAVVLPAMRRSPGLGVIAALVVVAASMWLRGDTLASFGLAAPPDFAATLWRALLAGSLLALASQMVIDPVVEKFTGRPHDISAVDAVRGNLANYLLSLVAVWVLVALVEEFLFRGFLMGELINLLGRGPAALAAALLISSTIFGLAHWYQGASGEWSTGILGVLLGLLFIWSNFNLWLPILAHGIIDTILLGFIYLDKDQQLKHIFIR